MSAALFYGVGCIIVVTRSAEKRLDLESKRKIRHHLPEVFYEYAPYWCCATAIFVIMAIENNFVRFAALLLLIYALRNLILRHNNRSKKPNHF